MLLGYDLGIFMMVLIPLTIPNFRQLPDQHQLFSNRQIERE
jgi:hypothetical protein